MKNKIEDLRDHLFVTIESLLDEDEPMDIARAKAVSNAAQAIINSAKVEVDFLKVTGGIKGSGFIPYEERDPLPPGPPKQKAIEGPGEQPADGGTPGEKIQKFLDS